MTTNYKDFQFTSKCPIQHTYNAPADSSPPHTKEKKSKLYRILYYICERFSLCCCLVVFVIWMLQQWRTEEFQIEVRIQIQFLRIFDSTHINIVSSGSCTERIIVGCPWECAERWRERTGERKRRARLLCINSVRKKRYNWLTQTYIWND